MQNYYLQSTTEWSDDEMYTSEEFHAETEGY